MKIIGTEKPKMFVLRSKIMLAKASSEVYDWSHDHQSI